VLTYVLLSGIEPFNDGERDTVFKKILKCDYNFNDKIWKSISSEGVDFIQKLIVLDPHERMNFDQMTEHPWLSY
jgi:calcium/calmodulin-dependent protein kinase-4